MRTPVGSSSCVGTVVRATHRGTTLTTELIVCLNIGGRDVSGTGAGRALSGGDRKRGEVSSHFIEPVVGVVDDVVGAWRTGRREGRRTGSRRAGVHVRKSGPVACGVSRSLGYEGHPILGRHAGVSRSLGYEGDPILGRHAVVGGPRQGDCATYRRPLGRNGEGEAGSRVCTRIISPVATHGGSRPYPYESPAGSIGTAGRDDAVRCLPLLYEMHGGRAEVARNAAAEELLEAGYVAPGGGVGVIHRQIARKIDARGDTCGRGAAHLRFERGDLGE